MQTPTDLGPSTQDQSIRNRLLASLPRSTLAALLPHLERVQLKTRDVLVDVNVSVLGEHA